MAKQDKDQIISSILTPYIKASYPLIYICTPEENRAELECLHAARECKREFETWSLTTGLLNAKDKSSKKDEETQMPPAALEQARDTDGATIFLFRDLHAHFEFRILRHLI